MITGSTKFAALMTLAMLFGCGKSPLLDSRSGEDSAGDSRNRSAEEERESEPNPVAGTELVGLTYDNARVRCDFMELALNNYNVFCQAVALGADGIERAADTIVDGTKLNWNFPTKIQGEIEHDKTTCKDSPDNLQRICNITTKTSLASVEFKVNIIKAEQKRDEVVVVTLPFSVGVAAGFVQQLPLYKATEKVPSADLKLNSVPQDGEKLGFQIRSLKPDEADFTSYSICANDVAYYFTHLSFIYKMQDGIVKHYAGSYQLDQTNNFSNRYRVALQNELYLICDIDGVIVSDTLNHRVLSIKDSGEVSLFAGTGELGFSGDGGDATSAKLFQPRGLASSEAYGVIIADSKNNRIRAIKNGKITTIAGDGTQGASPAGTNILAAKLNLPTAIAVNKAGALFISDNGNQRIINVNPDQSLGVVLSSLQSPNGLAFDQDDSMYFADTESCTVKVLAPGQTNPVIVAGTACVSDKKFAGENTLAANAHLWKPNGVLIGANFILIADRLNSRIRKVSKPLPGIISTLAGGASLAASGLAIDLKLNNPRVRVDQDFFFIADQGNNRIIKVMNDGKAEVIAGASRIAGFDGDGDKVNALNAKLNYPSDVIRLSNGEILIADTSNHRLRKVDTKGVITTLAGIDGHSSYVQGSTSRKDNALVSPKSLAVKEVKDNNGDLISYDVYISSSDKIRKVTSTGAISTVVEGLNLPVGITFTLEANPRLLIAESGLNRIVSLDLSVTPLAVTLIENLDKPVSVAVDGDGKLYIANEGSEQILVSTLAHPEVALRFFGKSDSQNLECGTGLIESRSASETVRSRISSNLDIICPSIPANISVLDMCGDPAIKKRIISFAQSFAKYGEAIKAGNVVQVVEPCLE